MILNILIIIILMCLAILNAVCFDCKDKVLNMFAVILCSLFAGAHFALLFQNWG